MNLRHAGLHWNNGPSKDARLYALPSPTILMLATEARYRSADAFARGKQIVYRAIPRIGKRPAELKYNASKIADECTLLWNEQPHPPGEQIIFQALNEPTINTERGDNEDDFSNLDARFTRLAKLEAELEPELRRRLPPGTLLMSTPHVPDGRAYDRLDLWRDAANRYDVIGMHEYGPPEAIRDRVQWHLDTWPTKDVFLGEWHNDEPERTLRLLAEIAAREPRFLGAAWFIGKWYDAPEWWPTWKNLQDNDDLYGIFMNPPTVEAAPQPAPEPQPQPPPEPTPMTEYEQFIRDAARARGIDPDVAVRVANSEGGVTEPARRGTFDTGSSWWAFQLHYGGPGYEQYGTIAGMGNGFTALTGWQPGDPNAWRDAARYALNRAKANGWGAWYGAAHVGIGRWDGIDQSAPWDANAERWDYEGTAPPAATVTYNANEPAHAQEEGFDCSQESLEWALFSLGRAPSDDWLENTMIAEGVMSKEQGLLDASGAGLAAFVTRQYGEFGFYANNEPSVTFDGVALEGGHAYPLLIGGRAWGHWSGCRGYDAARDLILLANPSDGWMGVGQTMDRGQFDALGPFSMVRVLHPDLLTSEPAPPAPDPMPAPDTRVERARAKLLEALEILGEPAA